VVLMIAAVAAAYSGESVADLVARAQAAQVSQQPDLYVKAAKAQLKSAKELYDSGKSDEGQAALSDLVTYSGKATEAVMHSRHRMKETEIDLRKMADKLRDIKRTVTFEDQAPVQAAADRLEEMRTRLLTLMFGKQKK